MENKSNGPAVASLVTGIVSIVLCWVPLAGLVCGILALVFYSKAKKAIAADFSLAQSKGMATGGMVTGIIGLVLSFIYNIVWLVYIYIAATFVSAMDSGYSNF